MLYPSAFHAESELKTQFAQLVQRLLFRRSTRPSYMVFEVIDWDVQFERD